MRKSRVACQKLICIAIMLFSILTGMIEKIRRCGVFIAIWFVWELNIKWCVLICFNTKLRSNTIEALFNNFIFVITIDGELKISNQENFHDVQEFIILRDLLCFSGYRYVYYTDFSRSNLKYPSLPISIVCSCFSKDFTHLRISLETNWEGVNESRVSG